VLPKVSPLPAITVQSRQRRTPFWIFHAGNGPESGDSPEIAARHENCIGFLHPACAEQ
jgi:hypothetical protein